MQLKVEPTKHNLREWKHLCDVDFTEVECKEILMLIGADNPAVLMTKEIRVGGPDKPWAFNYKLGWALIGPTNRGLTNQVDVHFLQGSNAEMEELSLKEQENRFFFQEDGFGVVTDTQKVMSIEDRTAAGKMEESATIVDGHHQIGMLWKADHPQLRNNGCVALTRLQHLKSHLKKERST